MTANSRSVTLIITDGLGYNANRQLAIARQVWDNLTEVQRNLLLQPVLELVTDRQQAVHLAVLAIFPIEAEAIALVPPSTQTSTPTTALKNIKKAISSLPTLAAMIQQLRTEHARQAHYVPWTANAPFITALRNANFTIPTCASGPAVGLEALTPTPAGNSEVGHLHISSMTVQPQTSTKISNAITNGDFARNKTLNQAIDNAERKGSNIVTTFLLSGTGGIDGRIHSAWNHLEAFLELLFVVRAFPPQRLLLEAILDGRDSEPYSSVQDCVDTDHEVGHAKRRGAYLPKLLALLRNYEAERCLAWVVGRGIAMDRDYRESAAIANWQLLTGVATNTNRPPNLSGTSSRMPSAQVVELSSLQDVLTRFHSTGTTDQNIPPLAIIAAPNQSPRSVQPDDCFVNLNFRADRQRIKMALMAGATEFLETQVAKRQRKWHLHNWYRPLANVSCYSMTSLHPKLDSLLNVNIAFPIKPNKLALLNLWGHLPKTAKYVMVTESVKSTHMGYFIRGEREHPKLPNREVRLVIPSDSAEQGVHSDADFYLQPAMKMHEVARVVAQHSGNAHNRLIMCNLAAPDMLGHLLPYRFSEAVQAYHETDLAVKTITEAAIANGRVVILTSDHGNIEEYSPRHTANPVLTTIVMPPGQGGSASRHLQQLHIRNSSSEFSSPNKQRTNLIPSAVPSSQAQLCDISVTIATILGLHNEVTELLAKHKVANHGHSLVEHGISQSSGVE